MEVILIRHGETIGNYQKKYIGRTDQCLWEQGKEEILSLIMKRYYPQVQRVYVSPLCRCIETAELIYPSHDLILVEQLRECDFGLFENCNYEQLKDQVHYQQWLQNHGKIAFPEGEDPMVFRQRCQVAFAQIIEQCWKQGVEKVALVIHGGTIMAILEQFSMCKQEFYNWQVENGQGFLLEIEKKMWQQQSVLRVVRKLKQQGKG